MYTCPLSDGTLSGLNLCGSWVYCHSLCEFIRKSTLSLLCLEDKVSLELVIHHRWLLLSCHLLFQIASGYPREGIDEEAPCSGCSNVSLHTVQLSLFVSSHLLREEASLMMTEWALAYKYRSMLLAIILWLVTLSKQWYLVFLCTHIQLQEFYPVIFLHQLGQQRCDFCSSFCWCDKIYLLIGIF